jgi:hypothetical protein
MWRESRREESFFDAVLYGQDVVKVNTARVAPAPCNLHLRHALAPVNFVDNARSANLESEH